MSVAYLLDTGYLTELYRIPGHFDPKRADQVQTQLAQALNEGATLIVPVAVLFELCNHITGIGDGNLRRRRAQKLLEDVHQSREEQTPYLIEPAAHLPEFYEDLSEFAQQYASQGIGLTDTQILRLASQWKAKPGYRVHLWTFDKALKAREPDRERSPIQ